MNLNKNKYYLTWFKNPWSYVTGALLLSLMQIVTFVVTGNPWGVTAAFVNWGAWIFESFGGNVSNWYYFNEEFTRTTYQAGFLRDPLTMRNLGIIAGALLASLMASQFKIKKIKSYKHVIAAAIGGLFMGYGSSIAAGCNIGAFYSGIASLSLSGWFFAIFMFIGAIIGSKLLLKYLM
ncbi:MAG: YeeE/YedE thiosulfate transporter family protein [Eubacteriaceae bacterium]